MRDIAMLRANLGGLHPAVFGEIARDLEVLIRHYAVGRNFKIRAEIENLVWLANVPTFGEFRSGRKVLPIALRRASIDPGDDGVDIALRHAPIVLEFPHMRIRGPRRHRAGHYSL